MASSKKITGSTISLGKREKAFEIYLDLGFEDLPHFSVTFKKQFGCHLLNGQYNIYFIINQFVIVFTIVDSMPLEICKLSRSSRSAVCR
ncbi:hypothetical protein J2772_002143 [Chryseobacterium jejuense]|nr:hypothetical protein [Chryseobacterium jejuense]